MGVKEDFSAYVQNNCGNPDSGTASSYRTALEKLPADRLSVAMMDEILDRRDEYLTFWP